MDTKTIARRVALRLDPEHAWLLLRAELMAVIQDIATRPDDYRQAIERYTPTMLPENAAAIRTIFPGMLVWSEAGFGQDDTTQFEPLHKPVRVHQDFSRGNVLDPLFWCYYDHDQQRMDMLRSLQEPARVWRVSQGCIEG